MTTDTIRQHYLNFFAKKGHKLIASSSLIPQDDPTLLFTTAGMNQFKKEFLGQITTFRRATTCQRCLRTDDLDKVGVTAFHHTFFEMLGNFSFGDYFKEEAISWAWEFLTQDLQLDPQAVWVSVYQDDQEAYDIWKNKIGFPESKIVKLGAKDNFWPANAIEDGPNGPCGPCSEIFFDTSAACGERPSTSLRTALSERTHSTMLSVRPEPVEGRSESNGRSRTTLSANYGKDSGCKKPGCKPGCDCGRFVEIWNLVFTQFNRKDKGVIEPLPHKNIDTGMGLERMASVMQGVKSNFEIDIFKPIVDAIKAYPLSSIPALPVGRRYPLINAIADHIRAITFAIDDAVWPSNEQRGYVVRKLIRKAGFHGWTLGIREPFLYTLASVVADTFRSTCPGLKDRVSKIAETIMLEEKNFILTLQEAPQILSREFKGINKAETGHVAFKLHDTYGIPFEVTQGWVRERGFEIDEEEFNQDLKEQQERSKKFSKLNGGVFAGEVLNLGGVKESKFLGYDKLAVKGARILKLLQGSEPVKAVTAGGPSCQIVLDKTVFYAESGGQIGDRGKIVKGKNVFLVENTQKHGQVFLHYGKVESGKLKAGDEVWGEVDISFRKAVARAHTATHLLQAGLREVLGSHIKQAGSLVEADRLRFDFIHFEKISHGDLRKIEAIVQKNILNSHEVLIKETTLTQAKKDKAIALFEEKYEDTVRVITIGNYSKELCGGTHLRNSSEVGLFTITSESSIAKGVRRIEALTGELAWNKVGMVQEQLAKISDLCKAPDEKIVSLVEEKLNRLNCLEKEVTRLRLEVYTHATDSLIQKAESINGAKLICNRYQEVDIGLLRQIMDLLKSKLSSYALCLSACETKKASLVIAFSDDLVKKGLDASKVVKEVAFLIEGSGGGRPNMAQAGGANPQGIDQALEKFKEVVRARLSP